MTGLDKRSYQQIIELLTPLMSSEADRRALIILTFVDHPLIERIDFTGATSAFLPNLIDTLHQFGKLDDGRPALWAVLEVAREQVGLDQKHRIDALRPSFELPPPPRLDKLFVSYSRQNEIFARKLVGDLKDAGLRVWYDREKIKGGENWWQSIVNGIKAADYFVFCLSPDAIRSEVARDELLAARQHGKPIFAVMLEDCLDDLKTETFANIQWLSKLHVIDFTRIALYGSKLRELIESLPGYTPPDTYFLDEIDPRDLPNPFRGLEAFLEVDAAYFTGRDDAVADLIERIQDPKKPRLLAVVGASGSGKSSLVRAGLIPAIRQQLPFWDTVTIRPGSSPVDELADRLQERLGVDASGTRNRLRTESQALDDIASELLQGKPEDAKFVLVIDQFEEVFTLTSSEEQDIFLQRLLTSILKPNGKLYVVLTLRADFFDRLSAVPELAKLVRDNLDIATEMTPDQLRRSIEDPARKVGVVYEEGLVETILEDVRAQPGSLPLLQYALKELFERKVGRRMTYEAYEQIGGVKGALASRAENLFSEMSANQQEALRKILLRLVEVGDETITRRRTAASDLHFVGVSDKTVKTTLDQLTGPETRLLVASTPLVQNETSSEDEIYYEVSHEALLTHWNRVANWIDDNREDLRRSSEILTLAKAWDDAERNETSYLLSGGRLIAARDWLQRNDATSLQQEFIEASVKHEQTEIERLERLTREAHQAAQQAEVATRESEASSHRAKRNRTIAVVVGIVAAIIAIGAAIFTTLSVSDAQSQVARIQPTLFSANTEVAGVQPTLIAADATLDQAELQLAGVQPTLIAAEATVAIAISEVAEIAPTLASANTAVAGVQPTLDAASEQISEAQSTLVAATATLAAVQQAEVLARSNANALQLGGVALAELNSSDGNPELAALLAIRSLQIAYNNVSDEALVRAIEDLYTSNIFAIDRDLDLGTPEQLVYSPDGQLIAIVSMRAGNVLILQIADGQIVLSIPAKQGITTTGDSRNVVFDTDSKYVAVIGPDKTFELWDIGTGSLIEGIPENVVFGDYTSELVLDDGGRPHSVLSISEGVLELWNINTNETDRQFGTEVNTFAFNRLANQIITGHESGEVKFWDIETGEHLRTTDLSNLGIDTLAVSPSGLYMAAGGFQFIKLFDLQSDTLIEDLEFDSSFVVGLKFSRSSDFLAWSDSAGTYVWDIINSDMVRELHEIPFPDATTWSLADDTFAIAKSDFGNAVRLYDLRLDSSDPRIIEWDGFMFGINQVAYINENSVVSVDDSGSPTIWDVSTSTHQVSFIKDVSGRRDTTVAINPDRTLMATAGADNNIYLWSLVDSSISNTHGIQLNRFVNEPLTLLDITATGATEVRSLAFSDDGNTLVSGQSLSVAFWDIATGELLHIIESEELIRDIAINYDGSLLATSYRDNIIIWSTQTYAMVSELAFGGNSIAFAPQSNLVVAGGSRLVVWDLESDELVQELFGHTQAVLGVAFSPDARLIASASWDETVRIWNIDTGQIQRVLSGHTESVRSVAFSPDSSQVASGSRDDTIRIWDADPQGLIQYACSRIYRDFTEIEREEYGFDETPTCPN